MTVTIKWNRSRPEERLPECWCSVQGALFKLDASDANVRGTNAEVDSKMLEVLRKLL